VERNSDTGGRDVGVRRLRLKMEAPVPALFPSSGPIRSLLVGEAPGPDNRGLPFWGDRCGRIVYRTLADLGMADVPEGAWAAWRTAALAGFRPILNQVAITNVFDHLPMLARGGWGAPTPEDIRADSSRLMADVSRAWAACPAQDLVVIALGRTAWRTLIVLQKRLDFPVTLREVRHPSRSGRGWSDLLKAALTQ